jgi:hypothetical protein
VRRPICAPEPDQAIGRADPLTSWAASRPSGQDRPLVLDCRVMRRGVGI